MEKENFGKRFIFMILSVTVLITMMTRGPALTNNLQLHPDEHVFYLGAGSLLNAILNPGIAFEEHMEYPEGAYYFHALGQFVGKVISKLLGTEHDLQIWGRIASVSYFALGVFLGIRIMIRYLGKSRAAVVLYSLTMCFSLFFIEQSRYGTGDMISFMLLMLLINLTAQATESEKPLIWWMASFFLCGILGAVKYPQLVFALIPLTAFLFQPFLYKRHRMILFLLMTIAGFFLFSPKAMLDPGYVLRVIQREGDAYITSGTTHEAGGFLNHLAVMLIYGTMYSDFPLLLPLTIAGFFVVGKKFVASGNLSGEQRLFRVILPSVCILFFGYNLFVRLLFFRTYTPFFGIITLYSAEIAAHFYHRKGSCRMVMALLLLLMILRGTSLSAALSGQMETESRISEQLEATVDKKWSQTYVTSMFSLYNIPKENENKPVFISDNLDQLVDNNNGLELQPGQLVVTGAYGYHLGQKYIFPTESDADRPMEQWKSFRSINEPHLIGQAYPEYYYYLFGGWLRGGTLSQYEFPVNYIYYCKLKIGHPFRGARSFFT